MWQSAFLASVRHWVQAPVLEKRKRKKVQGSMGSCLCMLLHLSTCCRDSLPLNVSYMFSELTNLGFPEIKSPNWHSGDTCLRICQVLSFKRCLGQKSSLLGAYFSSSRSSFSSRMSFTRCFSWDLHRDRQIISARLRAWPVAKPNGEWETSSYLLMQCLFFSHFSLVRCLNVPNSACLTPTHFPTSELF
jgi:hypothetical protein